MDSGWYTTMKPSFRDEWMALPHKEVQQIHEKIKLLEQDPTPDAKVKKQLKHLHPRLHRIRSGHYRIFYTFEKPHVSLLALRRRDDDTYDEEIDAEFLGGLVPELRLAQPGIPGWEAPYTNEPTAKRLPQPITEELLTRLQIPGEYFPRLVHLQTEDDLLDCPDVPSAVLDKLLEYMFPRPLQQVMQQPDLHVQHLDDLLRFKEGELISFLLKLSPEQEKYVNWGMKASGPTLLKGLPGTGKSTIALYRVRSIIAELRKQGRDDIRILFTTYTNALINSSLQLLEQLLGTDIRFVDVQTADRVAIKLLSHAGRTPHIMNDSEMNTLLQHAIQKTRFDGSEQQKQSQKQTIEQMSLDYLLQEINQVIVARQLHTLKDYLTAARPGRKLPLRGIQRRAVWSIFETLQQSLAQQGKITWRQARAMAEAYVAQGAYTQFYDAVIIDEAQDLDPSSLRLLVHLCKQSNRIFVTADANQSIYGSGFNWSDVHQDLKFQGRTAILHANYRSTREIGEAAQNYLAEGALDTDTEERLYVNNGPQPIMRRIQDQRQQLQLLVSFFRQARSAYRMSSGACAVLCPTIKSGRAIAEDFTRQGLDATFMTGQELDLKRSCIKVITLRSAKGLEFPIVALAGFLESTWHTTMPHTPSDEEREEYLSLERRTMFVGMTRAMRALLVVTPEDSTSPLMQGFDRQYWNVGEQS
ncbi:UvrD-helicase domain-containing protein [Dictyobacter formicarum]|uniref:DNA 3'-5' helicase n=1 Tax=Dictyobacter formicarum TaxID=2778368 RepID=A0ABQ3VFF9_9CHLR|nr:UvrD-helicase domain-containing protein [Dictyobacter formicarum]GHO84905.1 DNA helicase [Dictyobacter formicarum]